MRKVEELLKDGKIKIRVKREQWQEISTSK
jgi:hypothetical protein